MKTTSISAVCALAAACSLIPACNGTGTITPAPQPPPAPITTEAALRDEMRQLFTEEAVWTRVYVIDASASLPELGAASVRLVQNEEAIGAAFTPYVGRATGDQLVGLFDDRVTDAASVIDAVVANDGHAYDQYTAAWYANANRIANVLATANPSWSEADLRSLLRDGITRTLAEIFARARGDWPNDVTSFDAVEAQNLALADSLTDGLTAQYTDLVSTASSLSAADEALHLGMRQLWEEHVAWTRFFFISDIAGLSDGPITTQRLLQNQLDIGNAVRPYYGNDAGDALAGLLTKHILGAAALVDAAKRGNQTAYRLANIAWYRNADDIAAFLAQANPNWSETDLRALMYSHLEQTTSEALDYLHQAWTASVADYDAIEMHIIHMADALSDGITAQFPGGPVPPM